jgi:hypothetical protein
LEGSDFYAAFDVLTAVKINILIEVFWVVMPCSVLVGYQRFGGTCFLCLQGESSMILCNVNTLQQRYKRRNPEDLDMIFHRPESLKSRILKTVYP